MKKSFALIIFLVLCGAGYLLFKGPIFSGKNEQDKIVLIAESTQSQIPALDTITPIPASTKTVLEQVTEDESAKNESPILACKPRWGALWKSEERDLLSEPDAVKNALKISSVFSAKLAYALSYVDNANESASPKERQTGSRLALLLNLIDEQPDSKILNYFLVSQCNGEQDNRLCAKNIFERAKSNDINNGAMWLQSAVLEARNENVAGVISALEQVVAAQEYNSYWAESIEVFDKALQSIGIENAQRRTVASIGYSAAVAIAPVHKLFQLCRAQAQARADLAQVCIDAGKRMAFDSKTLLNQSIGYGLQEAVYKALGDTDNETRISKLSSDNLTMPNYFIEASELMMHDSNLHRYWFEQLKLFGEKEAFRLSTEEAIRLSSDPDYDPC